MINSLTGKYNLLTLLFIILSLHINAQLKADFTIDNPAGCAPLAVRFTNTTTGASSAARYQWDFGNSNTGALKDAAAIYMEEKSYQVSLTVTDNNQTSTKTLQVQVYKKPVIDFTISTTKGCLPLPVTFTGSATGGDGAISKFVWDFGDGFTQETSGNTIQHIYNSAQKAGVTVTAMNTHGCYSTIDKPAILEVKPSLSVEFNPDKTVLCNITDPVQFVNTSSGPGTLSYMWDFGDGGVSAEKEPSYRFNTKGNYTVQLSVTSSEGCTAVRKATNSLNVASFSSDFDLPSPICRGSLQTFVSKSTSLPDASTWKVDGNMISSGNGSLRYTFNSAGSHKLTLINRFATCIDSVEKTIEVKAKPDLRGFIAEIQPFCELPASVKFSDTTAGVVKREWDFEYDYNYPEINSNEKEPTHSYVYEGNRSAYLKVFNADGCSSGYSKTISIKKPNAYIHVFRGNVEFSYFFCLGEAVDFKASSSEELAEYLWEFGDGKTSTEAAPVHFYKNTGTFYVALKFVTKRGCKGIAYFNSITVSPQLKADFVLSETTVCGDAYVTFTNLTPNQPNFDNWYVDDKLIGSGSGIRYQFKTPGKHTIKNIIAYGVCRDTMIKVDYVTVLPPITEISAVSYTCDGTRGEVTFTQKTQQGAEWTWDFRDGTTVTMLSDQPVVKHTYNKTGRYSVLLTSTNGNCTTRDSIEVNVLLKQQPLLVATKTEICPDETLSVKIDNLERNFSVPLSLMVPDFKFVKGEYGDGSSFTGTFKSPGYYWHPDLSNFDRGKDQFRIIMQSTNYLCYDTSNFIALKVKGAAAKFTSANEVCHGKPVLFTDLSETQGSAILSWEWIFGDGQTLTQKEPGNISHVYSSPGDYVARLKVTDASGCSSTTSSTGKPISVMGPKAAFTPSATNVPLFTAVTFNNQTNNFGSASTTYSWTFGDGGSSVEINPVHVFNQPGTFTVKLVALNAITGCSSETVKTISVGNFVTSFRFNTSHITKKSCPPVMASFQNTSTGFISCNWDFGDGTTATNLNNPTHIYNKAGFYKVTLRITGANGLIGIYADTVIVTEPVISVSAEDYVHCTSQPVTLTGVSVNASSYFWDFGDGTVINTKDSFAVHSFKSPGTFSSSVLVTDLSGCTVSATSAQKIVIDSLSVSLNRIPDIICTPKEVFFDPSIINLGGSGSAPTLTFQWNFGTGKPADISDKRSPSFNYDAPGVYDVIFNASSTSGCFQQVKKTVTAFQGLGGKINGPQELCEGGSARFTGSTALNGQPAWKWLFHDGSIYNGQYPPAKQFGEPGIVPVTLLVDNAGCIDTVMHSLIVRPKPMVRVSENEKLLCEGATLTLSASGASAYTWSPATALNNPNGATVSASPIIDTRYIVEGKSEYGCLNRDSVKITVAHPIQLYLPSRAVLCAGNSVMLNATGGSSYGWIGNTTGLSSSSIAAPIAKPAVSTSYTVVAYDAYACFTDTASVYVDVKPVPKITAGDDVELFAGSSYQMRPISGSDIITWHWSPSKYLSCTNCAAPEARPLEQVSYVVTVTNKFECVASDTVTLKMLCDESRIAIPNAFSPNGDGLNDLFTIHGISLIEHLAIYNRWGSKIFERNNFNPAQVSAAWNGTVKGMPAPIGTYAYVLKMECPGSPPFIKKGTIILLR